MDKEKNTLKWVQTVIFDGLKESIMRGSGNEKDKNQLADIFHQRRKFNQLQPMEVNN